MRLKGAIGPGVGVADDAEAGIAGEDALIG